MTKLNCPPERIRWADQPLDWAIHMKLIATFMLLAIVTVLAGCSMYPITEEERARQERMEQERRVKVINTGY